MQVRPDVRLDLSVGQGNSAKAALMARVPFVGVALSEQHARRLEVMLTDFIHELMKQEGSAHYRPECCGTGAGEEESKAGSKSGNKSGVKNKETPETADGEAKPKKKPRKNAPKAEEAVEPDAPKEGGEDAGEGSPLPW